MKFLPFVLVIALCGIIGSCDFTYKIKSGEEAFEVKQYAVASGMLLEEYDLSSQPSEKARLAYLLGSSYSYLNDPENAARWFLTASEDGYTDDALVKYAANLRKLEHYEEAIGVYRQLMAKSGGTAYRGEVTVCQQAMIWQADIDKSEYQVNTLLFNSVGSDFAPYVIGPDLLLFTSDRANGSSDVYNWTGRGFCDVYVANTELNSVESFDPAVNSKHNDGTVVFSSTRETLYFSRCFADNQYDMYCKLMMSEKRGDSWSEATKLPFVKDDVNYGSPVLSANDSLMIFSCDDVEGIGGFDLYYTQLSEAGWSTPTLLSNRINTMGDEKFPTLHNDTMYFSSNHPVGMGGLDIFKSYITANGEWTPPYNLKPPINSGRDDFGFTVDTFVQLRGNTFQQGYFSSARSGGVGADDIYGFKRSKPEVVEEVIVDVDTVIEDNINYELYMAIRVMEPIFADPNDPNSERVGKRPLVQARVNISEGMFGRTFRTDDDGYLIMSIDWEKSYHIEAMFRGFLKKKVDFNANVIEKDPEKPVKTHNIVIVLEPIFVGQEITLQNIYYDLDKWDIRSDAQPSLNELASILKDNGRIKIELGSHTDCRADDAYNLELSQKRAQSAVDYLVGKGVKPERMIAKGYGETNFAINCECGDCTDDEHQANRRTTFKIIE